MAELAPPAPTSGPPVAMIVIAILVIIGVIVGVVMATRKYPVVVPPPPVPVAPTPAPPVIQFDESCIKPSLQSIFQGDAPFIPEYISFLKTNKVQTVPLGAQCPSGTGVEGTTPDMKCQACVPNEFKGKPPPIPDELLKQMNAWNKKKNENSYTSPAPPPTYK